MLIDIHTHCFPERLAQRAVANLADAAGGIEPVTDGTVTGLRSLMKEDGVDISVVQNIAVTPHSQKSVNDFAAEINSKDVIAFGSVSPDAPDALEELERIKSMGLKGVKFHPEYQSFYVDEERMRPIYKKIGELGLITLFHAGADIGFAPPYHCTPKRLKTALSWFDSPVIAAHWGGYFMPDDVINHLCGLPLYFDTSFGYCNIPKPYAQMIVEKHGEDNILFGSDIPWNRPSWDVRFIKTLELGNAAEEKIFYKNAVKLLGV